MLEVNKPLARRLLMGTFQSIPNAARKLNEPWIIPSFTSTKYPAPLTVINYFQEQGHDVSKLYSTCKSCGVKYYYTPNIGIDYCEVCNNPAVWSKLREVETIDDLIYNLKWLDRNFGSARYSKYKDLLAQVEECKILRQEALDSNT